VTASDPRSGAAPDAVPSTDLRALLAIPEHFKILFMQGGGIAENAIVPLNLSRGGTVDFVLTGSWSQKSFKEAQRCLNCDVQTVFDSKLCIECDACVDICPMDCITFTENGEEKEVRHRLNAPALNGTQDLYVGNDLKTGRIMVKDEDVCLHCGLCAERCPTGAWDMRKYYMEMTHAEHACRKQ